MIKKDLKLFVNVGENSLALRKLMAEHLESMGIDASWVYVEDESGMYSVFIISEDKNKCLLATAKIRDKGKEITVAEFFNLTEADLKEPVKQYCDFDVVDGASYTANLTQDQIDRVWAIFEEGKS